MTLMFPPSPDPLRLWLAQHRDRAALAKIAAADYGQDVDLILAEFERSLATGVCNDYLGSPEMGSPYECCLLNLESGHGPWASLFAAWWIGAFCSSDANLFVLIDNSFESIMKSVVLGCSALGQDATRAAIAFILWLDARDPCPVFDVDGRYMRGRYDETIAGLRAHLPPVA